MALRYLKAIQQRFIPVKAAWLNLMEPWWRLLRREAFAGQSFVDAQEVNHAAADGTRRLNARAKPWVWGRPARTPVNGAMPLFTAFKECSRLTGFCRAAAVLGEVPA
jgi:hypothetical protein